MFKCNNGSCFDWWKRGGLRQFILGNNVLWSTLVVLDRFVGGIEQTGRQKASK